MKPSIWLWPLSIPYHSAIQIRNRLYDLEMFPSRAVDVPVISVGNITVGGTGKTPFVIHLTERLKKLGLVKPSRFAIVSRGYGRSEKGTVIVSDGRKILSDPFSAGDEPYMMAESGTGAVIIVDSNRVQAAKLAIELYKSHLIILDDGFQHRRLQRDLDIVLLDGQNPLGNKLLLPAGILREPVSCLTRAGIVILSKCTGSDEEIAQRCQKLEAFLGKPVAATRMIPKHWRRVGKGELLDAREIAGKRVAAFAGIAWPSSFFDMVAELGGDIVVEIPLPDHCNYGKFYLDKIAGEFSRNRAEWLVTTAKDAVKLSPILKLLPLYQLQVSNEIVYGGDKLDNLLRETVNQEKVST